jgi:hypothetical protein
VAAEGYKRILFFAPEELAKRVKAAAALEGVPMSELLNRIIGDHLKKTRVKV